MKNSGFENIDAGIRSVILISVAAAYFSWDIGFEYGVYGELFFEKVFVAWSVSLALLIIFVMMASGYLIGSNHHRFLTCDDFKLSGHFVPDNCSDR